MSDKFKFTQSSDRPLIISGPCAAESLEILDEVLGQLKPFVEEKGGQFLFKSSFDKANRSSINSYRGPGIETTLKWFGDLKSKFGVHITTDIHESHQAAAVGEVVDVLQIPAFLCRQTDLIHAAVKTSRAVSVKKGQFLAPEACSQIVSKVREMRGADELNLALIERGTSFGYSHLVVDMTAFKTVRELGAPVIFDLTHSLQRPSNSKEQEITGGAREFAPLLARSAAASGYVDGYFLEVHPDPKSAKSDSTTQLTIEKAKELIEQIFIFHKAARDSSLRSDN